MTRKLLAIALAAASLYCLPAAARTDVDIILNFGPPPIRYEPLPFARHGYVWVPGYWNWNNRRHVWVAGHYVRERPGHTYRAGRWEERHGRWAYSRPGWQRGADRDRDGIPDRYDRRPNDRDNDGIPDRRDRSPRDPRRG